MIISPGALVVHDRGRDFNLNPTPPQQPHTPRKIARLKMLLQTYIVSP